MTTSQAKFITVKVFLLINLNSLRTPSFCKRQEMFKSDSNSIKTMINVTASI